MNAEPTRRITGLGNFSGALTHHRWEATPHRPASNVLHIDSDNEAQYLIRLSEEQDTAVFVDKIISAFRFNPTWRENFRVLTHPHDSAPLRYLDGSFGVVDLALQVYVQELNDRGFRTTFSCEGDHHPMGRMPGITFAENMPDDLAKVWSALGWVNMDLSVSPIPCHGQTPTFRMMFFVILDDWMYGSLDLTGKRYRQDRVAKPWIPELPPVNKYALKDHQGQVSKRVLKMNRLGADATFDDLVKLRCGRDTYTTWKLPALRDALVNDPALDYLEKHIHDTPALQRALRWRMRGLDLVMVLKKHEVDQVLESRALRLKQEKLQKQD